MKKLVLAVSIASVLSACSSTDPYQKRGEAIREQQTQQVKTTVNQAPKWFMQRPKNTPDVVYGIGFGSSSNMMMAMDMSESEAYRQLCVGAGGQVDSQQKLLRTDNNSEGTNSAVTAIRTRCASLDITGAEIAQSQVIPTGNRFNYYVLVALPIGDANSRARAKEQISRIKADALRFDAEFKELDTFKQQ